jgi:hypothetical protein
MPQKALACRQARHADAALLLRKVRADRDNEEGQNVSAVISAEQARQITRGRVPLVPVEYETAVKALTECCTLDESKYWSDKADALAAWAKIFHSNETLRKAKQLKLHAFRRMGQLAAELRPKIRRDLPGPQSLLRESGLSRMDAMAADKIGKLSVRRFDKILEEPRAPTSIVTEMYRRDPLWAEFSRTAMTLRSYCRNNTPASIASAVKALGDREAVTARDLVTELAEWLDEFESRLPKVKA